MADLRDEVRALRHEVEKLGNENRHLLEMIKDVKGEIDVERVLRQENDRRKVSLESNTRVSHHTTKPKVESLKQLFPRMIRMFSLLLMLSPTSLPELIPTRKPGRLKNVVGLTGSRSFNRTRMNKFTSKPWL